MLGYRFARVPIVVSHMGADAHVIKTKRERHFNVWAESMSRFLASRASKGVPPGRMRSPAHRAEPVA